MTGDTPQPGETPRTESNPWSFPDPAPSWWRGETERPGPGTADGPDADDRSPRPRHPRRRAPQTGQAAASGGTGILLPPGYPRTDQRYAGPTATASDAATAARTASDVIASGPATAGSATADSTAARSAAAGPTAAGPVSAGPVSAGPASAGPAAAGSNTAGPNTAGPAAAGPNTAGPTIAGPITEGPATASSTARDGKAEGSTAPGTAARAIGAPDVAREADRTIRQRAAERAPEPARIDPSGVERHHDQPDSYRYDPLRAVVASPGTGAGHDAVLPDRELTQQETDGAVPAIMIEWTGPTAPARTDDRARSNTTAAVEPADSSPSETEPAHRRSTYTAPAHRESAPFVDAHTQRAHNEPAHTEAAHTEAAHTEAAHTEAVHTEAVHSGTAYTEAVHTAADDIAPAHDELAEAELAHTELMHTEPDVMVLPEPSSRNRPTVALERGPVPGQARVRGAEPLPRGTGDPATDARLERVENSPFWLGETERVEALAELDRPVRAPGRSRPRHAIRRPAPALLALVTLALVATFFAWVSAEPFWLAIGHGTQGYATTTACTGTGVTQRCVGTFTSTDGRFTVGGVTLLGVDADARAAGTAVPARMVSPASRQAYLGDTSLLVHLRWVLGFTLVLICGYAIAGLTGARRLEHPRARRAALLASMFGPILLLVGFLAATY